MKKKEELIRDITNMVKETKAGKLTWDILCQTTEYQPTENKPVVREDDIDWIVDECYVSYYCKYRGQEFLMITYEMIHSAKDKTKSTNLVFLPPLGIRYFDINTLLPYSVELDQVLLYHVHTLWETVLALHKERPELVKLDADERVLTIEEDI